MRKLILFCLISLGSFPIVKAQVGIGNAVPETTSVLDLSNSTSKGLLLPMPSGIASMSNTTSMLYFYNDNIYYRRSDGYNALSPWKFKFNGNLSNNIYYNLGGNIGVGLSDITVSPLAPLQIETDNALSLVDDGSFLIGSKLSTSLAFNSSKIQSRDTESASDLQINEQGGDVLIGSSSVPVDIKISSKAQELDQPSGTYYDLVPTGTIVMWYGSTSNIPTGWAMCDGNSYSRSDNNGQVTTPNLSGRFVVAVGNNGDNSYSAHESGGEDEVTLTINQMPSHRHDINDPGHRHRYADRYNDDEESDDADDRDVGSDDTRTRSMTTDPQTTGIVIQNQGGGQAHENRPRYYALIYIMKL